MCAKNCLNRWSSDKAIAKIKRCSFLPHMVVSALQRNHATTSVDKSGAGGASASYFRTCSDETELREGTIRCDMLRNWHAAPIYVHREGRTSHAVNYNPVGCAWSDLLACLTANPITCDFNLASVRVRRLPLSNKHLVVLGPSAVRATTGF